jgi:hypothetical protein
MTIIVDYRIGGEPRRLLVSDHREALMRLPDEVQKCVVFIGRKELDPITGIESIVYGGTGFFVGVPTGIENAPVLYLVTAAHVAKKINDGQFCLRFNTKKGNAETVWVDAGVDVSWWYHPTDPTVDAAALEWSPPPEADYRYIPEPMFLDPPTMADKGIGVGDEIFITGLFSFVTGKKKNLPIVRAGNLAMVPSERVPSKRWHKDGLEAYLIESRSIGGLSGSPVFVQRSIKVHAAENTGKIPLAAGAMFWLGLIHGHWDVDIDQVDGIWKDGWAEENGNQINVGMAIVVPSHKIMEVLEHPGLVEKRGMAVAKFEDEHQALLDSISPAIVAEKDAENAVRLLTSDAALTAPSSGRGPRDAAPYLDSDFDAPPSSELHPKGRERFNSLLGAAAKKPAQED